MERAFRRVEHGATNRDHRPIFEELLKFGVALTIGAAIFGRSIYSRIAIALVIGCIFGLVEHSSTYAGEPDILYLYRVLFHSVLTMISVAVYTTFEERNLNDLLWIAPIYPIVLHYLNNAFAVLSGVVLATTPEGTQLVVSIVFGGLVLLLGVALLSIAITRHSLAAVLHREPYLFLRGAMISDLTATLIADWPAGQRNASSADAGSPSSGPPLEPQ